MDIGICDNVWGIGERIVSVNDFVEKDPNLTSGARWLLHNILAEATSPRQKIICWDDQKAAKEFLAGLRTIARDRNILVRAGYLTFRKLEGSRIEYTIAEKAYPEA